MGTNESWLAVKLGSAAAVERLERSIVASYESRGAKLLHREKDATLDRMAELGRGAKLGTAIVPNERRTWAAVVDSRVGTSDARLAKDLAAKLRTTVFRYAEIDAASFYGIERVGPSMPARTRTAGCSRYPDLAQGNRARFLCFAKVSAKAYDEGPIDGLRVRCGACGYRGDWTPGYDVKAAPTPADLVAIRGGRPAGGRVLVEVRCPNCTEHVGLAAMRLEDGLLVDAELLAKRPATLDGFELLLASQREAIERVLPTPATLAAREKAAHLASALDESPRAALEQALRSLRLKARPTKPPPLSLVFAPTKDELVRAIVERAPAFDFRAHDLPGKLELRLVAWLGPTRKSAAVATFVESVKKLLVDGAFARHGRDSNTLEWMTALAFPLPDATWAALLMFETFASAP